MLVVKPTKVLSTMNMMLRSSISRYGPGAGRSTMNSDRAASSVRNAAPMFSRAVSR
ncbi:hypothetical protein D3C83_239030 [compost metagenome]